jgi:hypothetical protein
MAHTSETRWAKVNQLVGDAAMQTLEILARNRELFLQLLEAYEFAGNTDAAFASLLFKEEIALRDPPVPTAEETQMALDAKDAAIVLLQLWECANNVDLPAEDRAKKLRRMT